MTTKYKNTSYVTQILGKSKFKNTHTPKTNSFSRDLYNSMRENASFGSYNQIEEESTPNKTIS